MFVATLGMLVCSVARAGDEAQVQTETLLQTSSSWDGVAYKAYPGSAPELTILKMVIPPNTTLPWHSHPMPNAAYVLSGFLTVEKKDSGQSEVIAEGQVLPEMVGELHRGVTGEKGVELIVFYAGTKGMALSKK